MAAFDPALAVVLAQEGGYQARPDDPGNWTGGRAGAGELRGTNFGISAASYPDLDIEHLSRDQAAAIYRRDYWTPILGDELADQGVALMLFDAAVNQGVGTAIRLAQQALGIAVDGVLGPHTRAALLEEAEDDPSPPQSLRWGTFVDDLMARRAVSYAHDAGFALEGLTWSRRLADVHRACVEAG